MSEIGQTAPSVIVKASPEALMLVDALLSCVAFPGEDWEIADSTLPFWSTLAGCILGLDFSSGGDRENVQELFFPVYSTLLDALLLRAQVDNSTFNGDGETVDLPDSLLQFRMNLVELLVDICQLLGSAAFMQKELWPMLMDAPLFQTLKSFLILFVVCPFEHSLALATFSRGQLHLRSHLLLFSPVQGLHWLLISRRLLKLFLEKFQIWISLF